MTTAAGGALLADLSASTILATGGSAPQTAAEIAALANAALPGNDTGLLASLLSAAVATLPTTLPTESGALWLNGGVLQLS